MNHSTGRKAGAGAPAPVQVAHLRPRTLAAIAHITVGLASIGTGLFLASSGNPWRYAAGQLVLAFAFVHAFIVLHEAGHDTLFPNRRINRLVGHIAGFVSVIPFWSWQRIHARHHRYAGWQDLDATTAALVPRPIRRWEQRIINFAWAAWVPLFALTYRIQNFWSFSRVAHYITKQQNLRRIRVNILLLIGTYALVTTVFGPIALLQLLGPAFMLSLMIQEGLILSQHTHVPQRLSEGRSVKPFTPAEQEVFTRSLRLPPWLSTLWLHFDAHELHHIYPFVPGYELRRIRYEPINEIDWWCWLRAAKRMRGTDFLFRNRDETGIHI